MRTRARRRNAEFPGNFAGASLKREVGAAQVGAGEEFPGNFAGASLKPTILPIGNQPRE